MVSVIIHRNQLGQHVGFQCSGHAGYGEKGSDIVCAAVSVLTQTTLLALEQLVNLKLFIKADPKSGYLNCRWNNRSETLIHSELLMKTMILGLNEIQSQYPEHLGLSEAEV